MFIILMFLNCLLFLGYVFWRFLIYYIVVGFNVFLSRIFQDSSCLLMDIFSDLFSFSWVTSTFCLLAGAFWIFWGCFFR